MIVAVVMVTLTGLGVWLADRLDSISQEWWASAAGVGLLVAGLGLITMGVRWRLGTGRTPRRRLASQLATDAGLALTTGAIIGLVLFMATGGLEQRLLGTQEDFEEDRFNRETRRDNIRFVREVVTQPNPQSKPFAGLDLGDAQLAGLNLSGAILVGADLQGADLTEVNLSGAYLSGADLSEANLFGANLSGAHVRNSGLLSAQLARLLELAERDQPNPELSESTAALIEAYLPELSEADLSCSDPTNDDRYSGLSDVLEANLSREELARAGLSDLLDADLSCVDLSNTYLLGANLSGVDLSGIDLSDTHLVWDDLSRVDLSRADLSEISLFDTDLSDVDLSCVVYDDETVWPEGFTPPPQCSPPG